MVDALTKVNDEFHSGLYTAKIRKDTFGKFNLAGFFPVEKVNSKQITITDVWKGEEAENQVKGRKKKLMPKGTGLRRVRYSEVTPEGFRLEQYGIELEVEMKDLLERNLSVNDMMTPISDYLAQEIDNNVYQSAVEVATDESTNYGLTNNWTSSEIKDIIADITKIKNNKLYEGYNITNIALGMEALTELQIKAEVQGMEYTFPKTGLNLNNAFELGGLTFSWGGKTMDGKELLAFCTDMPSLQIFYLDYFNPYVRKVPSTGNYDKYMPLINVLKYDDSDRESEPLIKFQFTTGVGTFPLEKGKRMVKVEDVLGN
jgi:hypothetical protein